MQTPPFTVCVVSRIHIGELPYINAFIQHYQAIGVDKIYLVITKRDELAPISEYIQQQQEQQNQQQNLITYICVDLKPGESISMDNMNQILSEFKTTYTLHIDIDEFIELDTYPSIKALISEANADKIHFPWAITVNDQISDVNSATPGMTHRKKPYKTMCKTALISHFISNGHDFETHTPTEPYISPNLLIHYWGRTYNDIILKALYANGFKNAKTSTIDEVVACIANPDINALPNRLKMLALLSRLEKPLHLKHNYSINYIDYIKENELISPYLTPQQCASLYAKYVVYRNKLDYKTQIAPYYELGLLGIDWSKMNVTS